MIAFILSESSFSQQPIAAVAPLVRIDRRFLVSMQILQTVKHCIAAPTGALKLRWRTKKIFNIQTFQGHEFPAPRRTSFGQQGRPIMLKSNHLEVFQSILLYSHIIYILPHDDLTLQVSLTPGYMYAYRVSIQPSGCPRKINREIVKTMVEGYSQVS